MEMGSFIELQFPKQSEYYPGEAGVARLNTGRAAIYHAFRRTGCRCLWLPYYQCDTVRDFLTRKQVELKYYHIDGCFDPVDLSPREDEAVLLVNYYGIMSHDRMAKLAARYTNAIIDNSQGFFAKPVESCFNVYSCRKFVGVPDGAYVLGAGAEAGVENYGQGYSSDTALFLLQRIEYGCEGKAYESRRLNEERIDREDILQMSKLTRTILQGTDYEPIRQKRKENFAFVHGLLKEHNCMDPMQYYDDTCVPMVYPFVAEDDGLLPRLLEKKHFQGHWWSYLLEELPPSDFAYWLSRYMIPITIDQRYGKGELKELCGIVLGGNGYAE